MLTGDAMRGDRTKKTLPLQLDPATDAWLKRLARVTGDPPPKIVLSMLRQIRIDDEMAHGELPPASSATH